MTTTTRFSTVTAVAVAGALALGGCSGSSTKDATSPSGSASSKGSSAASSPSNASADPTRTKADASLPTQAELDAARKDVSKLTTKQLAGQVIVGYYTGRDAASAAAAVTKDGLGGVIMMGDNVPTDVTAGTQAVTAAVQKAVKDSGRNWPAVMGTDQEGGQVARFGAPVTQLPAAMAYGAANDATLATQVTKGEGEELRALGLNMVFAPDADVTIGASDPTVGSRSPGGDPQRVANMVNAQVKGFQESGLVPVIKHFPGHGSISGDSHVGIVVQKQTVSALMKRDWVPFTSAIKAGAPVVMTGHIVLPDVDPNVPATLSRKVITGQLRDKLGFKGLIITDGMNMGAIANTFDRGGVAAVSALKAGADVVLMPTNATASVSAIVAAVNRGELSRDRLIDSAARIVATMRHQQVKTPPASVIGTHHEQTQKLARESITQLGSTCGANLVGSRVSIDGVGWKGTERYVAELSAELRRRGVSVGAGGTTVHLIGSQRYNAGVSSAEGGAKASASAAQMAPTSTAHVQVALDVPYELAKRPAGGVGIATYGHTADTISALADVLTGKAKAGGTLPVAVGSLPIGSTACH